MLKTKQQLSKAEMNHLDCCISITKIVQRLQQEKFSNHIIKIIIEDEMCVFFFESIITHTVNNINND